jgi:hypothetical protein
VSIIPLQQLSAVKSTPEAQKPDIAELDSRASRASRADSRARAAISCTSDQCIFTFRPESTQGTGSLLPQPRMVLGFHFTKVAMLHASALSSDSQLVVLKAVVDASARRRLLCYSSVFRLRTSADRFHMQTHGLGFSSATMRYIRNMFPVQSLSKLWDLKFLR